MLEAVTSFFLTNITVAVAGASHPAIFVLMFLESALVPIPSEVTMPFAGYLASQGRIGFWEVVFVGGTANLTGSLLVYWLGSWGQEYVHQWVRKYGKFLLITVHEVETAERWFRSHGEIIAFSSRLLPVVRTFISLPAGMSRMDIRKFAGYTLAGSLIWSAFLAYIGLVLGKNWHSIDIYFKKFQFLIIAIILVMAVLYIWNKIKIIKEQNK